MTYYLYHIPGKKIGVTTDCYKRVTEQQGYEPDEYEIITSSEDIDFISKMELELQEMYGYKVDMKPYNKLKCNNMRINVTEQTTTFPCPVSKLKGQLIDNMGMKWETDHGEFSITKYTIDWIMRNVKTSQYTGTRCYVYNKAFARFYDNHQSSDNARQMNLYDQRNGRTLTGALSPTGIRQENGIASHFDLIREWAETRGLYENGDPKTQALKLVEEVGETCKAILNNDKAEIVDGIGDCVVVLTNLAKLAGYDIEFCIEQAYNEISKRTGKMVNGTFVKDE